MKTFEYAAPKSLAEATDLLADTWGKTEVLAGGTDLVTSLKQLITTPERVVSLRRIADLRGISAGRANIRIGAATTLHDIAAHAAVREHFPALITVIEGIGSPQMLTVGTLGGELCQRPRCWYFRNGYGLFGMDGETSLVKTGDNRYHAIFGNEGPAAFVSSSSIGPVLVALGATLQVTGPKGKTRQVTADQFFVVPRAATDRETALKPNEILTAIELPLRGLKNAAYEIRHRRGLDWPYATAAVAFKVADGKTSEARVVLGHVAPKPWVAEAAAQALEGAATGSEAAGKAAEAAASGAKPLSHNAYKVQLVKAAVRRAIIAASA